MSPIKGLTDRESIQPRFPRLGKLRKGGQKTANGFGPDLEHFRFTSDNAEVVAAFQEAYGDKPAMVRVYLPHPRPEQNFETWKELWSAGGLQHRCDGEYMQIWLGQDGKYHREPKKCTGGCDEVGRLNLILPELWLAGFVGYVTLETHSINDLVSITESLAEAYIRRQEMGLDLTGLEFTLRRVPEKISVPGFGKNEGKRQRVEKWLVKIEPSATWVRLQIEAKRNQAMALLGAGSMPAPTVDQETGEIIDAVATEVEPAPAPTAPRSEDTKAKPPKNGKPKVSEAAEMKTQKGSRLGDLKVEQLKVVEEKGDGALKLAAQVLLEGPSGDAWRAWDELGSRAEAVGLPPNEQPSQNVTNLELYQQYTALKALVEEAEAVVAPEAEYEPKSV